MKIAYIPSTLSETLFKLDLEYLNRTSNDSLSKGDSISIIIDKNKSTLLEGISTEINVQEYEIQELSKEETPYRSQAQQHADAILETISQSEGYDLIECSLWGGIGISVIRAKKLLGLFQSSKIAINCFLNQSIDEAINNGTCDLEKELMGNMETYCLRYADQVQTPFSYLKNEFIKTYGISSIHHYSCDSILESVQNASSSTDQTIALKFIIENEDSEGVEMKLNDLRDGSIPPKYTSPLSAKKITLLVPFSKSANIQETSNTTHEYEYLYFCDSEQYSDDYLEFSPEAGLKVPLEKQTLEDVMNQSTGDFILILNQPSILESDYIDHALIAFNRNPELSFIGSYTGKNGKYAQDYVPSLMAIMNTCTESGNLFKKSALKRITPSLQTDINAITDLDLINALHQKYLSGDIIPSTYFDLPSDTFILSSKDQFRKIEKLSPSLTSRLLSIIIESPEILTSENQSAINRSWDYKLNLDILVKVEKDEPQDIEKPEPTNELDSSENKTSIVEGLTETEHVNDSTNDLLNQSLYLSDENDSSDKDVISFAGANEGDDGTEQEPSNKEEPTLSIQSAEDEVESPLNPYSAEEPTDKNEVENIDYIQLFWGIDNGFSEDHSEKKENSTGNDLVVEFTIECENAINSLRLDPCNQVGVITLRRILIIDETNGDFVFYTSEENAFDNIEPSGDITVDGIQENALILNSTAGDPQILIPLKALHLNHFTIRIEYDYMK